MQDELSARGKRPRLKDIAQEADVSIATVSLVLNNRPGVGAATRQHVMDVLKRHGFEAAEHVDSHPTVETISFVVYDREAMQTSDNPFFSAVMRGVETEARNAAFDVNIRYVRGRAHAAAVLDALRDHPPHGIILDASVISESEARPFIELDVPLLVLDNYLACERVDAIAIDNYGGTRQAVGHLIEAGHTEIGTISTSVVNRNFEERHTALLQLLHEHDLRLAGSQVFRIRPTQEGSYHDMLNALRNRPKLPHALFAQNDIIAFGAIRAMKQVGIRVPDDISIVGFDDLSFSELIDPPLSTVHVFTERMATHAVRRLVERMRGDVPEFIKIRVGTALVTRASVRCR